MICSTQNADVADVKSGTDKTVSLPSMKTKLGNVVYCSIDCFMKRYGAQKRCVVMRNELEYELEWHEDKRRKRLPNG